MNKKIFIDKQKFESLNLGYDELKSIRKWCDSIVEDTKTKELAERWEAIYYDNSLLGNAFVKKLTKNIEAYIIHDQGTNLYNICLTKNGIIVFVLEDNFEEEKVIEILQELKKPLIIKILES